MSNIDKHAVQAVADLKAGYTLGHADVAILNELARIALASLEAEAVAFVMADDLKDSSIISTPAYRDLGEARERTVGDVVALFTAPPAPVSVPDAVDYSDLDATSKDREVIEAIAECKGWNACRAAMLQGANGNSPVISDCVACSERMPGEVLAALQNVARLRRNLNDFCGEKSVIAKCLIEAEEALINAVNRHSTMLSEPQQEAKNV